MNVLIRADASFQIGSGHVARSIPIARWFKLKGNDVKFACSDLPGNMISQLESQGFKCLRVSKSDDVNKSEGWHNKFDWSRDVLEISQHLHDWKPDLVWLDHYGIDRRWQIEFQKKYSDLKFFVFDDLANRELNGEFVINPNLMIAPPGPYEKLVPLATGICLGPQYSSFTLDQKFLNAREKSQTRRDLRNVLVFFGSADKAGACLAFAKAASQLKLDPELQFTLVAGSLNQSFDEIKSLLANTKVRVLKNLENFADEILGFDLAIGSAGVNGWERAYLGLPSYLVQVADNQEDAVKSLIDNGAAKSFGKLQSVDWSKLLGEVSGLRKNKDQIASMSESAFKIWGDFSKGLQSILDQAGKELTLRNADLRDSEFLFELRNDPQTVAQSIQSKPVTWEEHSNWFANSLKNQNRQIYVASHNGEIVGMGRADWSENDNSVELSWAVVPSKRGTGYGTMLVRTLSELHSHQGRVAKIKAENIGSQKAASAAGFRMVSDASGLQIWKLK